MRKILSIILCLMLVVATTPMAFADDECKADLKAAESLLDEAADNLIECDTDVSTCNMQLSDCEAERDKLEKRVGYVALLKDRTLHALLVSTAIALAGGITGAIIQAQSK